MDIVNSKEYWDQRFEEGDWDAMGGREQSLFFSKVAYSAMPDFLVRDLSKNSWSVVDIGCAEGEGTAYLAKQFPLCRFTGVDFSEKAIEKAAERHSNCDFAVSNIYKDVVAADVVFSSNTLEHLRGPRDLMERMCAAAGKYMVLLLPLEDSLDIEEHINIFSLDTLPLHINEFYLEGYTIVDCRPIKDTTWPGKQVLLVYTSPAYRPEQITLQDVHDHFKGDKDQRIAQLSAQNEEQKTQISQFIQQASLLETQVQKMEEQAESQTQELEARAQEAETRVRELEAKAVQEKEALLAQVKEKEAFLARAKEESERLNQQAAQWKRRADTAEAKVAGTLAQLYAMSGSKLFKLVHFVNRFFKQGFHKEKAERKNFRKWIMGRFRHVPDLNHSYNPIFAAINILEGSTAPKGLSIQGALRNRGGKLAEHLKEQSEVMERAAHSALTSEAKNLRNVISTRKYKGIMVYPHVVFWEPLQTPQQLLRAFAKEGWLCFFCELPTLKDVCREVEPNLFITYESDLLQAIGETEVTVLLTWMGSMSFADHIPNKKIWYHVLDHLQIFSYYDELYLQMHQAIVEHAQFVSYVARPLKVWVQNCARATYLPNGANTEEFVNVHSNLVPEDMRSILDTGHKIIGYYGYLAEWMDYVMVREMACRRPDLEFVMVGKVIHDTSLIEGLPNVHLLGLKPYQELPDYAKFFDVATIPFMVDEKMDCVSPIKFYEYLALGKPVVTSAMKELEPFSERWDFISCARGADEFLYYVDQQLSPERKEAAAKEGPLIAAQNTWLERARQAESLLAPRNMGQEYTKQDIIILSVIDYNFRHQRPQHIAQRLAAIGHRVYYVNANFGSDYAERLLEENLWQVTLPGMERVAIHLTDWADDLKSISDPLEGLLYQHGIRDAVLVMDYPNWIHAALYLRQKYGFKILTDYMDDFTGFLNPAEAMVKRNCEHLLRESDGIVASSQFLYEIAIKYNSHVTIDRNGTEYAYFHQIAEKTVENKRPVVGYYGAIAEWFNVDAVCRCAQRFPQCDVILVGNVTAYRKRLEKYPNIQLVGEVPYSELLPYLERFDVCLIPFDTSTDLIKATNPVKFYEYLSAGKKIVATEIPELEPYRDRYVYMENDPDKFCDAVELCLKRNDTLADAEECFRFARENDWDVRAKVFEDALGALYPKISIVVLCYNQLEYTKQCVQSILNITAYPNYELILVDNCSSDDTAAYLQEMEKQYRQVKIVLNKVNRGFAGGNNDGIAVSDGEYIVLLNNDTVVTRGWLTGMLKHFADDAVGLVGPVTNSIGNEAKITVQYQDVRDMPQFAYEYTFAHMGEEYPHHGILAMFCLMISRKLYDQVGPLDEGYGIGMFEDDDYSTASQMAGFRNVLAEDVFIHHFGSVSFKKLEDETYMALHRKNRQYFEKKWRVKWSQPQFRPGVC